LVVVSIRWLGLISSVALSPSTQLHTPPNLFRVSLIFFIVSYIRSQFERPNKYIVSSKGIAIEKLCSTKMPKIEVFVFSLVVTVLTIFYSRWQRKKRTNTLKIQHGCKDPAQYPHQDQAMGSDLVRLRMEAMKEGKFFRLYASQFEKYGKTWQENWRGKPLINTTEPANVQQVAARAMEDYGKDPERVKAQSPFFGPSIFSDGAVWKHAREMVKPIFTRAEISDIRHLESFVDRFMELLPIDEREVDVQPLLNRLVCLPFRCGHSC
jgi:hypothetical protein